jgi:hypothetical protein
LPDNLSIEYSIQEMTILLSLAIGSFISKAFKNSGIGVQLPHLFRSSSLTRYNFCSQRPNVRISGLATFVNLSENKVCHSNHHTVTPQLDIPSEFSTGEVGGYTLHITRAT